MKHLNIEKSEVSSVWVSYDVNKFTAYVKIANQEDDNTVVFATSYNWIDLAANEELLKYCKQWEKPMYFSHMAQIIRKEQLADAKA